MRYSSFHADASRHRSHPSTHRGKHAVQKDLAEEQDLSLRPPDGKVAAGVRAAFTVRGKSLYLSPRSIGSAVRTTRDDWMPECAGAAALCARAAAWLTCAPVVPLVCCARARSLTGFRSCARVVVVIKRQRTAVMIAIRTRRLLGRAAVAMLPLGFCSVTRGGAVR